MKQIHLKKTTQKLALTLFLVLSTGAYAQVGIGTSSPEASAALEVQSTTKGFLLPRMSNAQMNEINSPVAGLMLYCTDCSTAGIYAYNGSGFVSLSEGSNSTSNTSFGSELTIEGANGEAFSTNTTCGGKVISATNCSNYELNNGIGTDPDGSGYTVVQIGDATSGYNQCWMAENMQDGTSPTSPWENGTDNGWFGYFGDGDQIPDSTPENFDEKEGFLYQWSAVMNGATSERAQGICPTAWHIPSDCEWMFLENNLGMSIVNQEIDDAYRGAEGAKLRPGGSSNFEGILVGFGLNNDAFTNRGSDVGFWTSTDFGSLPYVRFLYDQDEIYRGQTNKSLALNIRCLKD